MSRTHAHRPVHARGPAEYYADHDHRDGACDLPTLSTWQDLVRQGAPVWTRFACRWRFDYLRAAPTCACQLCSASDYRRRAHRAERRAMAQLLASWSPATAEQVDDACSSNPPDRWAW